MKDIAARFAVCLAIFAITQATHAALIGPVDHSSFLAGLIGANVFLLVVND